MKNAARRFPWLLMIALIALDIVAFLLQKTGSSAAAKSDENYLLHLLTHPWVWLALSVGPLQLWVWTRILARADISKAYPLTSLTLPLTVVAAWAVLGEHPAPSVWIGAVLISIGAAAVGPGEHESDPPSQPGLAESFSSPQQGTPLP